MKKRALSDVMYDVLEFFGGDLKTEQAIVNGIVDVKETIKKWIQKTNEETFKYALVAAVAALSITVTTITLNNSVAEELNSIKKIEITENDKKNYERLTDDELVTQMFENLKTKENNAVYSSFLNLPKHKMQEIMYSSDEQYKNIQKIVYDKNGFNDLSRIYNKDNNEKIVKSVINHFLLTDNNKIFSEFGNENERKTILMNFLSTLSEKENKNYNNKTIGEYNIPAKFAVSFILEGIENSNLNFELKDVEKIKVSVQEYITLKTIRDEIEKQKPSFILDGGQINENKLDKMAKIILSATKENGSSIMISMLEQIGQNKNGDLNSIIEVFASELQKKGFKLKPENIASEFVLKSQLPTQQYENSNDLNEKTLYSYNMK